MGLNIKGGNKTKKQKRNYGRYNPIDKIEPGQMFAQIIKNNGGHFDILCTDNVTRIAKLSGSLKKGPRIITGSYVVISLREFEAEQKNCDIIGIANPPNNIIGIFKQNNPVKYEDDIEFCDSDDEFKDFEDSKKNKAPILNSVKSTNIIDNGMPMDTENDEFDWDNL